MKESRERRGLVWDVQLDILQEAVLDFRTFGRFCTTKWVSQ